MPKQVWHDRGRDAEINSAWQCPSLSIEVGQGPTLSKLTSLIHGHPELNTLCHPELVSGSICFKFNVICSILLIVNCYFCLPFRSLSKRGWFVNPRL